MQDKIVGMDSRLHDINTYVGQMMDLQKESNGNAIIVFTLVTIVFLPLSWATSYIGMNTSDIRNTKSGQWLFWTVAVPVTLVVIVLSLLVVLKGETIRELLIKARSKNSIRTMSKQGVERTFTRALTSMSTMKIGGEKKKGWDRFRGRWKDAAVSSKV